MKVFIKIFILICLLFNSNIVQAEVNLSLHLSEYWTSLQGRFYNEKQFDKLYLVTELSQKNRHYTRDFDSIVPLNRAKLGIGLKHKYTMVEIGGVIGQCISNNPNIDSDVCRYDGLEGEVMNRIGNQNLAPFIGVDFGSYTSDLKGEKTFEPIAFKYKQLRRTSYISILVGLEYKFNSMFIGFKHRYTQVKERNIKQELYNRKSVYEPLDFFSDKENSFILGKRF